MRDPVLSGEVFSQLLLDRQWARQDRQGAAQAA